MQMRKSLSLLTIVGVCSFPAQALAFVQGDLDRLLKDNECPKCDLSGAVLAGMDLSKAKLEGANLSGADLSKASLRMADMAQANLSGANLSGAVFEAADLFQANLTGANTAEALFGGAYLAEASMDESQKVSLLSKVEAGEKVAQNAIAEVAQGAAAEVVMEAPLVGEAAQGEPSGVEGENIALGKSVVPDTETAPVVVELETPESEASSGQMAESDATPTAEEVSKGVEPAASATAEVQPDPSSVVERGEEKVAVPEEKSVVADKDASPEGEVPLGTTENVETPEPAVAQEKTAASSPVVDPPQATVSEAETADAVHGAASVSPEALLKQVKKSKVCVECDFSGMTLGSVSMKGFYLERANFAGAQMAGANFKEANLKSAKFSGANLQGATFKGADLYLADFSGANLEGADFRGAAMDGATLGDATLTGAQLDEVKK